MFSKDMSPLTLLLLTSSALARTDLKGCTSFTTMVTFRPEPGYGNTYASVIWYVPDTLEICQFVDCGGGRAPPKSVPGCPLYEGPETVTAEFLTADPMKPTLAMTSEEVKETGSTEISEGESVITTSLVAMPTTIPVEDEASETMEASSSPSSETEAQEKETATGQGSDAESSSSTSGTATGQTTATGANNPSETGAAAGVAANVFAGAAVAPFALL